MAQRALVGTVDTARDTPLPRLTSDELPCLINAVLAMSGPRVDR